MGLFSRKKSAPEIVAKFCDDVKAIAKKSPFHDSSREQILQSELLPFAFLLFDSALYAAGKNRYAYQEQMSKFLSSQKMAPDFDSRINFYAQFMNGKEANMFYWLSDRNDMKGNPLVQVTGAFCDMLYDTSMKDNYDSAPLMIYGIDKVMMFVQNVFMPVYQTVGQYIKDIQSL